MSTQPCNIYLHPSVTGDQSAINAIVARTGLAVVVGTNRAALSLVQKQASRGTSFTIQMPEGWKRQLNESLARIEARQRLIDAGKYDEAQPDPGNGGWIGDDPDPFDGGGRAA